MENERRDNPPGRLTEVGRPTITAAALCRTQESNMADQVNLTAGPR